MIPYRESNIETTYHNMIPYPESNIEITYHDTVPYQESNIETTFTIRDYFLLTRERYKAATETKLTTVGVVTQPFDLLLANDCN